MRNEGAGRLRRAPRRAIPRRPRRVSLLPRPADSTVRVTDRKNELSNPPNVMAFGPIQGAQACDGKRDEPSRAGYVREAHPCACWVLPCTKEARRYPSMIFGSIDAPPTFLSDASRRLELCPTGSARGSANAELRRAATRKPARVCADSRTRGLLPRTLCDLVESSK